MIRINQLYRQNRDLSYTGVWDEHPLLLFAAVHYFRNWSHALTACGIDHSKVRRHEIWSRNRIKRELISLNKQGEDLSYNEFEKKHRFILYAAIEYFGSWRNAITRIGLDYNKIKRPRGEWSKEKIIKEIKALKEKGVDLSWRAMRKQGYGPLHTMSSFYFGSWRRAVTEAGLDYNKICKREKWSKKKIIAKIKSLHKQGVDLSYNRLRRAGYGKLASMGIHYFPNWGKAIEAAGLDYSKIRKREKWSSEKIIKMIKDFHQRGVDLSYRSLIRAGYIKLVGMGQHYFENWGNAIEAAGLDYAKIRKRNQFTLRKCYNGST